MWLRKRQQGAYTELGQYRQGVVDVFDQWPAHSGRRLRCTTGRVLKCCTGLIAVTLCTIWLLSVYTGLHPRHWLPSASVAKLHRLPLSLGARCLDGSQPAIYVSHNAASQHWIVYLGQDPLHWCIDDEDCWQRSGTPQGSSDNLPGYLELRGILSNSELINPHYHNWSKAVLHACDGSGFLGYRSKPFEFNDAKLYSHGNRMIFAAVSWLRRQYLATLRIRQSQLLFIGQGASGIGLMVAAPKLLNEFPHNRVKFAAEGSVLPETIPSVVDAIKQVSTQHEIDKNPELQTCIGTVDFSWRCLLLHQLTEHLADAAFMFSGSNYDTWLAKDHMQIPCPIHDCRNDERSLEKFNSLRDKLIASLSGIDRKSRKDAIWMCSCGTHSHLMHDQLFNSVFVEGHSLSDAVAEWYSAPADSKVMHHYIDHLHPSNPTCPVL